MSRRLFHVVTDPLPLRDGGYWPASLDAEGFVHLCHQHQLPGVRVRFFAGQPVEVWVLNASMLDDVRDEDSYGHGVFPHLYGPIPTTAVVGRIAVAPGADLPALDG